MALRHIVTDGISKHPPIQGRPPRCMASLQVVGSIAALHPVLGCRAVSALASRSVLGSDGASVTVSHSGRLANFRSVRHFRFRCKALTSVSRSTGELSNRTSVSGSTGELSSTSSWAHRPTGELSVRTRIHFHQHLSSYGATGVIVADRQVSVACAIART
jgi:hypothetical protein